MTKFFYKAKDWNGKTIKGTLESLNKNSAVESIKGGGLVPLSIVAESTSIFTEIYKKMESCDLLIVASPVYFSAFPSRIKALIDRTQMIYNLEDRSNIKKKKILIIGIGGAPHYPRQFQAMDNTLEWYKKTLSCDEIGFVQFSHTDELPVLDNKKCLKELTEIAEKINTP